MASRDEKRRDPLEEARRQLDFAATAKDAPTPQEMLYKAQTIVPLAPPRPWWKIGAGAAALFLSGAILATPWIPQRAVLNTVLVSFEQSLPRHEAQRVISAALRELPCWALLSSEFAPLGNEPGVSDHGQLSLRITALNRSRAALDGVVEDALSQLSLPSTPLLQDGTELVSTERLSPLRKLTSLLNANRRPAAANPNAVIGQGFLDNEALFEKSLAERLSAAQYSLIRFDFLANTADPHYPYDFTTADLIGTCWPRAAGVMVRNYDRLAPSEQDDVRAITAEFLGEANLLGTYSRLTEEPQLWLPIVVSEVIDGRGATDRYLVDRLQAWIEQPTQEELRSVQFSVRERVDAALTELLPWAEWRIDYYRVASTYNSRAPLYHVKVTLTGYRSTSLREIQDPALQDEQELDW